MEGIGAAAPALGVVEVPVDTRAVRRSVVAERRRAAVALQQVISERWQVGALGHTLGADRTTDEVVTVITVVFRQLNARHRTNISYPTLQPLSGPRTAVGLMCVCVCVRVCVTVRAITVEQSNL